MSKRLLLAILLFTSAVTLAGAIIVQRNVANTFHSIQLLSKAVVVQRAVDEADLKEWATELASDEYAGRQAGYPGNNKAAQYIAKQFENMGIVPAGDVKAFDPTKPAPRNVRDYFQRFTFNTNLTGGIDLTTQNVVGMIEGSDPVLKKQIVVLGAHFDHVGQTGEGFHYARLGKKPGIWHGADDNASGTVTVMSVAKAFATGKITTKRTIVFILFSAEEGGLIGSKFFVDHPTVGRIEDYVFMLNLDMIGRNPNDLTEVKGMASAAGTYLRDIASDAVSKSGLSAKLFNDAVVDGGDSDHSSFGDAGVPFIFFFTGFHDDYHKVSDTADKLAYSHMVVIGKTAMSIVRSVADKDEPPVFKR